MVRSKVFGVNLSTITLETHSLLLLNSFLGCWVKVGNEERTWAEGKLTTLDTSFEHSTGNPTNNDRHVLIIDFWHPELSEAERAGLEFIYDLR